LTFLGNVLTADEIGGEDQVQENACDLLREYVDLTGVVQY